MTGRTHDLGAFTSLAIVFFAGGVPVDVTIGTVLLSLLANQIGGILPDIDQPTAPFWRNLPIGKIFGKMFDALSGGHRFLTHSLIGAILLSILGWLVLQFLHPILPHVSMLVVWISLVIGIISHLVMDTCTKEGVPWLLPIPIKLGVPPLKALRLTTGKFMELYVVVPALVLFNIWLFSTHYSELALFIHHLTKG